MSYYRRLPSSVLGAHLPKWQINIWICLCLSRDSRRFGKSFDNFIRVSRAHGYACRFGAFVCVRCALDACRVHQMLLIHFNFDAVQTAR